jgi:16S rRNA (cytidine1402-2'-O)-methyltransferase
MKTLFIVGTPIGNLEDISLRALKVLKEVDFIICEDTRWTLKLLNHFEIKKPLVSYHQHSRLQKIDFIIEELKSKDAALVSDAGTPGISDPGGLLIREIVSKLGNSIKIVAIPGPSALAAGCSISGLPCDKFRFLGFLPHKKGRVTLFKEIADSKETIVFYESPHRILKTLESLEKVLDKQRKIVVCRELTKIYEEIVRGIANEVLNYFKNNPDKVRGEFVVLVGS